MRKYGGRGLNHRKKIMEKWYLTKQRGGNGDESLENLYDHMEKLNELNDRNSQMILDVLRELAPQLRAKHEEGKNELVLANQLGTIIGELTDGPRFSRRGKCRWECYFLGTQTFYS